MKRINAYKMCDGKMFEYFEDAKIHASKQYADALSKFAREVHDLKYTETMEYVDSHIKDLINLDNLKRDYEEFNND
jgi:16S rRNA G527 N7-methylase RsmG